MRLRDNRTFKISEPEPTSFFPHPEVISSSHWVVLLCLAACEKAIVSFVPFVNSVTIFGLSRDLLTASKPARLFAPAGFIAMSGTMRGTPNRGQGRGGIPFTNSPASSSIPRPVLESTHASSSDAGGSSLSASRQKQSKRDEASHAFSSELAPPPRDTCLATTKHYSYCHLRWQQCCADQR